MHHGRSPTTQSRVAIDKSSISDIIPTAPPNYVATEMSSTNPSHPLSPSSPSPGQEIPSRPRTSFHPSDQHPRVPEEHIEQGHRPKTHGATTTGAGDETVNKIKTTAARDDGTEAPPFQPFFTLIEDAHTAEYHHPTVHYIFSDDDTDIVTEAALRSLETQQDAPPGAKREQAPRVDHTDEDGKSVLLPPPIPGVRENYIVLDVEPIAAASPSSEPSQASVVAGGGGGGGGGGGVGGTKSLSTSPAQQATHPTSKAGPSSQLFRVTSAKSFSPTWQVLSSDMVPAPTFENGNPGDTPGHGLMLKIHGTGGIPSNTGKEKGESGARKLEEMMDQFAKRMRELQMVIDAADVGAEEGNDQRDLTGDVAAGQVKDEAESGKDVLEGEHA